MNTNKSINRKIPIILTAKSNRIMLKEIFANLCAQKSLAERGVPPPPLTDKIRLVVFESFPDSLSMNSGKIGADGTGGRVEFEGFLKCPRGPKEIINIFQ